MEILKTCRCCGVQATKEEHLDIFVTDKNRKYGKASICKECKKRDYSTGKYLEKTYGITLDEYDDMLTQQDNKCAICGTDKPGHHGRFVVDHNHSTGEVRGLLCHHCNSAIGQLQDSPTIVLKVYEYLIEKGSK